MYALLHIMMDKMYTLVYKINDGVSKYTCKDANLLIISDV